MKTWKVRERCLRAVSWMPVGIWLTYMFLVTTIVILLVWSYCLATFSSPGYPSEILQKYTGYDSAAHGDISMVDQEDDAVHVGLLAPEQFYLSPAPSATNSPLLTNGTRRPPQPKEIIHQSQDRFSEEVDLTDPVHRSQPPFVNSTAGSGDHSRHSDSWSQLTYPISHDQGTEGLLEASSTPPPLEPVGNRQQNRHVVVRMTDDSLDGRTVHGSFDGIRTGAIGTGYDCDSEDPSDHVPLGLSVRRFTVKRDGKMRYCQKCKFEKPDRTHHCSSCKRCVLKMDHHCPWLNNCVGHKNYKAFYLFVLWTSIYCVTLVACTIPVVAEVVHLPYADNLFDPQWIFMILIGIVFGLCLVPFAIHHSLLIKSNKTTIESFEKHKYRIGGSGEIMQSRVLNVFDMGKRQNFIQVLGPVWYLWLVPVRNSIGNGWSFPANEYGRNMLQLDDQVGHSSAHDYHQNNLHHHRPHNNDALLGAHSQSHSHLDSNHGLNEWTHRDSFSPIPHAANIFSSSANNDGSNDAGTHSGYESYDMNDTDDPNQDPYRNRRDSDESDDELGRSRQSYHQPTPRRFRQRGGFAPTQNLQNSEDDEAEEYLYDSDEPATIRFT
ncbi:palmitoyltransferase for Vac8p [Mortierella alpina]|uniref:Palmitoyltransferase n=1 Tax=Mortierella alpina TaxID=64518 RepID=A0A9P6J9E0_MORAP|nr:palmitoyltransferase for Vac8p [Mortierella alpina]